MINVYLDDFRPCPKGFVLARSAAECILLLKDEEVDVLSLDFDLGWEQPNGLAVVQYIVDSGRYPRSCYFHTSSAAGRMSMIHLMTQHAPPEVVIHHGPMQLE
ncbi:cyclic-phosphate processing receiver domain-containing protein [Paenibacillus sp. R14(2021)]|uniref:cyclic-phosphate processing receiver domain-containing protein n=1 Tax=Paenibacillus sp. R14(2021) TaxID=2859228 RepID=UPI001C611954|nr:cyclic-phosphate processing receiver domain-containing protein [Paenibacillus sp. R14(2021)]